MTGNICSEQMVGHPKSPGLQTENRHKEKHVGLTSSTSILGETLRSRDEQRKD